MKSSLRVWQHDCIALALQHYTLQPHFFCQATPGAGKTKMAAELAKHLLQQEKIDLILCFAPSRQTMDGFQKTFSAVLGRRLDGLIGAVGAVCTYQGMEYRDAAFWRLFDDYRVFAVFDEIHHCAGHDLLLSNAWGQQIVQRIQDRATFTLALSGTPWRSDHKAIALARYSQPDGILICDYRYGLQEAIADGVCRSPRIVVLDNNMVRLTEALSAESTVTTFPSIAKLLSESPVSYEDLLFHDDILRQILSMGCTKLHEIRKHYPDAGGLVVATSIEHAHTIAALMRAGGEVCQVVTNKTPNAHQIIDDFRYGGCTWIIAVGMISEGTDIPRLRVCCHLSRIRTELHYRQVLGRILRRSSDTDDEAWLYVLAEPALQHYSERLADDLPDDHAVLSVVRAPEFGTENQADDQSEDTTGLEIAILDNSMGAAITRMGSDHSISIAGSSERSIYELNFSQHYRTQLLSVC
ncbi:DEAD/DEAH box helicase family protein [Pseudomonas sp. REP124]|uniref:DEAD/DEAH box helicase n=1 Tax=Pseudomonas sp. REP124 TaxID=2875731 RepID=UPI001CCFB1B3|nr:DEAD/DEAH box helicase family protein [Pseudomonas sp. REP124]MBZ9785427.1 DEAD/DEAH box helicase family protein [Pseudomonas sp. REP124]